jgi:antitoxin component YwqK of YwqJK toxin-antitoxin module
VKVLKFEPKKEDAKDLIEMLEYMKTVSIENGMENGIVIVFDKTGKIGSYSMVHKSPLTAVGWLEYVKQININNVLEDV